MKRSVWVSESFAGPSRLGYIERLTSRMVDTCAELNASYPDAKIEEATVREDGDSNQIVIRFTTSVPDTLGEAVA